MDKIMTPYVTINLNQVNENIKNMYGKLKDQEINHRPHIKTHKSVQLAQLEIEHGAIGVTCATITELEVMAAAGIKSILLAFPIIGELKFNRLYGILGKYDIDFITITDSAEGIKGLSDLGKRLNKKVKVLLDVDSGGHRGGVQSDEVLEYVHLIKEKECLHFEGLFIYYGHIYGFPKEYHKVKAKEEARIVLNYKKELEEHGIEVATLSVGSTLSSHHAEELYGVTESRAGNFIFYDMNAVVRGIATIDQCALRIVATVVSCPIEGKATIDAGSKAISTDASLGDDYYGYVVGYPEVKIMNLNEEHGFLEFNPKKVQLKIGDKIEIIPNHACVVPNLHHQVFLVEDGKVKSSLHIDARHRIYE